MLANVYSKSHIQSSQAAKEQARIIIYERLLPAIADSSSSALEPNGIDVHSLFLATAMDFISAYIFGISKGTNFIQNKSYRDHWLDLYNSRNEHHFWPQEMTGLTAFMQKLGVWMYPRWVDDANEELAQWNTRLCSEALEAQDATWTKSAIADEPVVMNSLNAGIDKEEKLNGQTSPLYSTVIKQRELSVSSELFDHVLAGQETTGTTLTYLCWHMSDSTKLQQRLRDELLTLQPNMLCKDQQPGATPDAKELDALPLLHGVIMETLRLHAPIPGSLARRTPYPSSNIGGYNVPGGVRISGLAHTMHRDKDVFPQPHLWDPNRWLAAESTEEERRERHRQFWAFSSGGRMCIGSNFAMIGRFRSVSHGSV